MPTPIAQLESTSPLSSVDSYVTAGASPGNLGDVTVTDISSPDHAEAESTYRKSRQLPSELKDHCKIYLEEDLHLIGLNLLKGMFVAGATSNITRASRGAYCPPPNQIAVLNTIIVHPEFTTRPRETSWPDVGADSLVYLRNLLNTVGPMNGGFKEAFRFTGSRSSRGESPSSDSGQEMTDDAWDEAPLRGKYGSDSIWRKGQDFFNVVGWVFNCSVLYPNRWRHWHLWLEFMLDVIEQDLHERFQMDEERRESSGVGEDKYKNPMLRDSILAGYINQRSGRGSGGLKWIMKAIFADGSKSSTSLFQEIWHREHKGISQKKNALNKRKREIGFEKGDYSAVLDDDSVYSSQGSEPPTPQKRGSRITGRGQFKQLEPTFVESIALRQRLFAQLSYLCNFLPNPPINLPDLYEHYEMSLKSQPLPIFAAFISGSASEILTASQISILQDLLELHMPSSAKKPVKVDAERYNANSTSPAIIEQCFLPNAANTIAAEDNAKVSLLLEEIVQLVWINGTKSTEKFGSNLANAVKTGVNARDARVKRKTTDSRGRRRGVGNEDDADKEARCVLSESGRRLQLLASLIKEEAEAAQLEEAEPEGRRYCNCQEPEGDDMIACDGPNCPYRWFHRRCVGLPGAPKAHWSCRDCVGSEDETMGEDEDMSDAEDTIEVSFMTAQSS